MQGLSLDVSTAGSIAHSLQALRQGCADKAVMEVVTLLATKPMKVCAPCCEALQADTHRLWVMSLQADTYIQFQCRTNWQDSSLQANTCIHFHSNANQQSLNS